MKLTNTIRNAFVRAAMQDVPDVDHAELIRKAVTEAALRALPASVRKVHDDAATRRFLGETFLTFGGVSVSVPGRDGEWRKPETQLPKLSAKDQGVINDLVKKHDEQESTRKDLERRLHGAAYSVSTRKALVDLLPEFEKYLPEDDAAANRTLPVIANIVADFTKAGWPKGKKAAAKSKVAA